MLLCWCQICTEQVKEINYNIFIFSPPSSVIRYINLNTPQYIIIRKLYLYPNRTRTSCVRGESLKKRPNFINSLNIYIAFIRLVGRYALYDCYDRSLLLSCHREENYNIYTQNIHSIKKRNKCIYTYIDIYIYIYIDTNYSYKSILCNR
jgi:hypothetical protein